MHLSLLSWVTLSVPQPRVFVLLPSAHPALASNPVTSIDSLLSQIVAGFLYLERSSSVSGAAAAAARKANKLRRPSKALSAAAELETQPQPVVSYSNSDMQDLDSLVDENGDYIGARPHHPGVGADCVLQFK